MLEYVYFCNFRGESHIFTNIVIKNNMDNNEFLQQHITNNNAEDQLGPRAARAERHKKWVRRLWQAVVAGIALVLLLFMYIIFIQKLPSFDELENPNTNLATEVLASDGSELGRFYVENRVPVTFDELPTSLKDALVATEDIRYYQHSGIDGKALGRVVVKTLIGGDMSSGGGSTITQQLAKLLYTERRASSKLERAFQKLGEWLTAIRLERSYTKEEIMAMYLNKFDFLYDAHGIKAAAEVYFNTSQDSLNIEQSAMLVGMLKNPALFNPVRRPDTTAFRRNVVMYQMVKNNMLDKETYDALKEKPLGLTFNRSNTSQGLAPYFREELRKEVKNIFAEMEKKDGIQRNVHTGGYKIYTTIDAKLQAHAEAAMWEHLTSLQKEFFKQWKGKDPWTYGATDEEKEIRKQVFEREVRASDRYIALREDQLDPLLEEIKGAEGIELKDYDIDRMLEAEADKNYLPDLLAKKYITKAKAADYNSIMSSQHWAPLKRKWAQFNKLVEANFSKPVKMTVFDYNPAAEKDTIMSPYDSMRYHRMILQVGSMAVDPHTGYIKVWVGGVNHKYFKFDHVNKNTQRQVGSTFKPFVYATAIEMQGISPCFRVTDLPVTIHAGEAEFNLLKDWTPHNAEEGYSGASYSLYEGLRKSKNTVSVYLMKQLRSTQPVRELVSNLGIDVDQETTPGEKRVPNQPSICLGAVNLSVFEMTGAFAAFANSGVYNAPTAIQRIEDKNGNIIYQSPKDEHQALPEESDYVMIDMMRKVVQGANAKYGIKSEIAGKTGTTNKHADGWYMGLTPNLVMGTWVGGDDRWIRFNNLLWGQGSRMAGPIFYKFLKRVEGDESLNFDTEARFKVPERELSIEIDCSKYAGEGGRSIRPSRPINSDEFFEDEIIAPEERPAPEEEEDSPAADDDFGAENG
jgi:penicillin-binding protein 1A